jgi:cellulose synthase/poly-beta-1,6-N-acetylglucosamine synthase-like glycosyltransferase
MVMLSLSFISSDWPKHQEVNFWCLAYSTKLIIECVASCFAVFYLLVAAYYRPPQTQHADGAIFTAASTAIAVAYLCCDDIDPEAFDNVVCFCARHNLALYVHDDSTALASRNGVDLAVERLSAKYRKVIHVLRRSVRAGGKPGAVNNLVNHLGRNTDLLLLCDSDSFLLAPDLLNHAVPQFRDPNVALVQFRNIGYLLRSDIHSYRTLARSVDFYDSFVAFIDRFGWSPFLGHNALIRLAAFREVGGFTPGQLADDIDFSVKLRLAGYKIQYARSAVCGERHPLTYAGLRRRTAKWSYGCTQVLLRWAAPVLFSRHLTVTEKATFFLTVAYYHFQVLLFIYLVIFYILLPFETPRPVGLRSLALCAGLILLLTFLPSITYFLQNRELRHWPKTALIWGLTYGSQDFVIVRAVIQCLRGRTLVWTPTNRDSSDASQGFFAWEVVFGILILTVGAWRRPALLILPTTALFAGKFLITPWLDAWVFGNTKLIPRERLDTRVATLHATTTCFDTAEPLASVDLKGTSGL